MFDFSILFSRLSYLLHCPESVVSFGTRQGTARKKLPGGVEFLRAVRRPVLVGRNHGINFAA